MKALFSKLNYSITQDISRRTKKENKLHTDDSRKVLNEGKIEVDSEKNDRQKKSERVKARVRGHEHVCPNGQGLQSRSVTQSNCIVLLYSNFTIMKCQVNQPPIFYKLKTGGAL